MSALHSPAADRNKQPILDALLTLLPPSGTALEIASGSGQHAAHFAAALPRWHWLASDPRPEALSSIRALRPEGPEPLPLDVLQEPWPLPPGLPPLDAIFCANMLHVSPWPACCAALMQGAARHLRPDGLLLIYGPFVVPGLATAASNLAFDADLCARDPAWGLRNLEAVQQQADEAGLGLREYRSLPANNLLLIFNRNPQP